jgi:hypothetical protein
MWPRLFTQRCGAKDCTKVCRTITPVFYFRADSRIRGKKTGGLGSPLSGFWPGGRQRRFLGCTKWTPDAHAVPASTEAQQENQ